MFSIGPVGPTLARFSNSSNISSLSQEKTMKNKTRPLNLYQKAATMFSRGSSMRRDDRRPTGDLHGCRKVGQCRSDCRDVGRYDSREGGGRPRREQRSRATHDSMDGGDRTASGDLQGRRKLGQSRSSCRKSGRVAVAETCKSKSYRPRTRFCRIMRPSALP